MNMVSFPRGRSGLGLLVLRIVTTVLIVAAGARDLIYGQGGFFSFLAALLAILVALGLFTTASAAVAAMLTVALYVDLRNASPLLVATTDAVCLALALTGAGAYSLDSLLFGQRRVTLSDL